VKKNLTIAFLLTLVISACGSSDSANTTSIDVPGNTETTPVDVPDDTNGIDPTFTGVPYDYVEYQDALDKANLQQTDLSDCTNNDVDASCSKSDVVKAGGYNDYEDDYFYIDEYTGWLTFEMRGDSNRTELRFSENFKTDTDSTIYTLSAEILPVSPSTSVQDSNDGEEITLLQVHNKGENGATDETVLSHPLLRIVWDGESRTDDASKKSYSNGYWAIIKTNAFECKNEDNPNYNNNCPDSYDAYYLGAYNALTPIKFDVVIGDERLVINVDDNQKVDFDIAYWSGLYSYFKAGVYNQYESGNSVVMFKSVSVTESD